MRRGEGEKGGKRPAPRRPPRAHAGRQGSLEGPPRLSPGSRGSRTAGRVQRRPRGSLVSFGETKRKPHVGARRPEAGWGGSLRRGTEAGPEAELDPRIPKVTDTRPPRGGARETAGAARSPDAGAARERRGRALRPRPARPPAERLEPCGQSHGARGGAWAGSERGGACRLPARGAIYGAEPVGPRQAQAGARRGQCRRLGLLVPFAEWPTEESRA